MQQDRDHPVSSADAEGESVRHLFEAAIQSLQSGLVMFDQNLTVILRNQAAAALLPAEEDAARLLEAAAGETSYEDWATEIRRVMETGLPRRLDTKLQRGRDEPEVHLELTVSPLRDASDGRVMGGLLSVEDVTGRATMERRLAVSERMAAVGKLAARVAHELNNPLDGILRYTNMAKRLAESLPASANAAPGCPVDKMLSHLEKSRSGIVRMTEIISSLLEFSRSAPGNLEDATINKIVEDAVMVMEGRAADAKVAVVCNFLQTDMPVARCSNIFQVFCNVIKNAIDAMPDGGTLTITTRLEEPNIVITFEDTGIGLPDEIDRIFEPFFTTKAPGKGTGLGLAVCREVVEKYQGTITAGRRQPRGTVITIAIPSRTLLVAGQPTFSKRRCQSSGSRKTVPGVRSRGKLAAKES